MISRVQSFMGRSDQHCSIFLKMCSRGCILRLNLPQYFKLHDFVFPCHCFTLSVRKSRLKREKFQYLRGGCLHKFLSPLYQLQRKVRYWCSVLPYFLSSHVFIVRTLNFVLFYLQLSRNYRFSFFLSFYPVFLKLVLCFFCFLLFPTVLEFQYTIILAPNENKNKTAHDLVTFADVTL